MTGTEIRKEAAAKMNVVTIDPVALSLVELKPCRRCLLPGLYSTARGLEGCSTCVSWKPGFRLTTAGATAYRKLQIDAQLRSLRIEYKMMKDLAAIGEEDFGMPGVVRRGQALRAELATMGN